MKLNFFIHIYDLFIIFIKSITNIFILIMPLGSGRKRCLEWEVVSEVQNYKNKVSSDFCGQHISAKTERIKPH